MPGPVSDCYHPEFSTQTNADEVRYALKTIVNVLTDHLGSDLKYILEVVRKPDDEMKPIYLSERQLRIIRFGLNYAIDAI